MSRSSWLFLSLDRQRDRTARDVLRQLMFLEFSDLYSVSATAPWQAADGISTSEPPCSVCMNVKALWMEWLCPHFGRLASTYSRSSVAAASSDMQPMPANYFRAETSLQFVTHAAIGPDALLPPIA